MAAETAEQSLLSYKNKHCIGDSRKQKEIYHRLFSHLVLPSVL